MAIGSVRKSLGLTADNPLSLEQFPVPLSTPEKIMKMLKGIGIQSSMVMAALSQWQGISKAMSPFLNYIGVFSEPVTTVLPLPFLKAVR